MIPALVLTAGLATRLRPLSLIRAKAAMPLAGDALVRRILRQLHAGGVRAAVLNLHHLPHTITREVGDGSDLGMEIRYSWEMPVLGSAGGPRQALPLLEGPTFLIVNGDTLTDVDVAALVDDHRRTGALVTMAVVPNRQPEKYGSVLVEDGGIVTGFSGRGTLAPSTLAPGTLAPGTLAPSTIAPSTLGRTPAPSHPRTPVPCHFIGVQVAEAAAFASVPAGAVAESVGDVYPALIRARPGAVRAHATEAAFLDIGTPRDYLESALDLAARTGGPLHGAGTQVDPTARVEDSLLWEGVIVGAGASLRGCVVTDGVRIPDGTAWTGVTLRPAQPPLAPGEHVVDGLAVSLI